MVRWEVVTSLLNLGEVHWAQRGAFGEPPHPSSGVRTHICL